MNMHTLRIDVRGTSLSTRQRLKQRLLDLGERVVSSHSVFSSGRMFSWNYLVFTMGMWRGSDFERGSTSSVTTEEFLKKFSKFELKDIYD